MKISQKEHFKIIQGLYSGYNVKNKKWRKLMIMLYYEIALTGVSLQSAVPIGNIYGAF